MAKFIANPEIVQGTGAAVRCRIPEPLSCLTVFLEFVVKEGAKSVHRFFVFVIGGLLIKINRFLQVFLDFNPVLVEISHFVEGFVAWV